MHYIIVSDIFGRNESLLNLASELSETVEIVDPYHGEIMQFQSESDAYAHFTQEIGVDKYSEILLIRLKACTAPVTLIGFSVGASAIWRISERRDLEHVRSALCFYGSQIRHYENVLPKFPVKLIFPKNESHFSVPELVGKLSTIKNVTVKRVEYSHGFMNQHSVHYSAKGYNECMSLDVAEL